MYAYLRGTLIAVDFEEAVVEVQGIGYRLAIPANLLGKLPQEGSEILLYTSWVVREHAQTLYGFLTKEERDLFEILITLSGVGPKTGLGIIGHLDLAALEEAVRLADARAIAKVPGIGKKTAERLILDLRGKISLSPSQRLSPRDGKLQDALQALLNLGYTRPIAEKALNKAADTLPDDSDLSTLITEALKY